MKQNKLIEKMLRMKIESFFGNFLTGLDWLIFIKMITLVWAVPMIIFVLTLFAFGAAAIIEEVVCCDDINYVSTRQETDDLGNEVLRHSAHNNENGDHIVFFVNNNGLYMACTYPKWRGSARIYEPGSFGWFKKKREYRSLKAEMVR